MACALILSALPLMPAQAQRDPAHRVFPATALRGDFTVLTPPEVQLNGAATRLAPGARIRGEDNQLIMSAAVSGQRFTVHYTREPVTGLLLDVWILRPAERSNRPWPANETEAQAWTFDVAAQTWKKP